MRKTKTLGIVSGICFFMSALLSGDDAAGQKRQIQILLIAAGASQITLFLMAKELDKKFEQINNFENKETQ